MIKPDFTTTLIVDESPEDVFNAINNVRGWWSEDVEGPTEKLHDVFNYHYEDIHRCRIKIIESIPGKKVGWHVLDNYFKFTEDTSEWTNTKISFEITRENMKTHVCFTHHGLVPSYECFEICKDSWTNYIQVSLRDLITTGKGAPNASGKPRTENERKLSTSESK
jgi:hypothetical protein